MTSLPRHTCWWLAAMLLACGSEQASSDASGGGGALSAIGGSGSGSGGLATPTAGQPATNAGSNGITTTLGGVGGASAGGTSSATGGSSAAGAAGTQAQAGAPHLDPPLPDSQSELPIANPGGKYTVEGNLPYGPLPRQRLDVMYPKGAGPSGTTALPGVIMFHGGGWIQGDKATMSSFYSRFLAHGFVVCSVEYRVASDDADGAIAPAAVEDALLAAKWFWSYLDYYHVDRTRYVVTGASAGGHLALMVGMATPAAGFGPTSPADYQIAAIVDGYGPTDVPDLLERGTSFAVQWLPAGTPDRDALAKRLSPVSYVRKDLPPLLVIQGSNDTTVPVAQSQELAALAEEAGAEVQLHLVTGAGHGFTTPTGAWPDAEKTIFGFLTALGIGQ